MTRDMGMALRHSSRITNFLGCVFILEHCTALRWRVAHLGRFSYCALAHPVVGPPFLQVQGACEETARPRG